MESVQKVVSNVVNDPQLFKETRYTVASSLPLDLGSISLGYSNDEPKIYLTKMVGQEGCIDWDIKSFIDTWKNAIIKKEFTPELNTLFQGVTNELMPGFAYDIGTFHWFLRPHCQDTKIGFALFGSRSFNLLASNGENSLNNSQFLSENVGKLIPLSSFVFRRVNKNLEVGDVSADIFIMVSSTSNIFVQLCFKFVFTPNKLNKNIINIMSSNVSNQSTNRTISETINNNTNKTINAKHGKNGDSNHSKNKNESNHNEWERKKLANTNLLYSNAIFEWLTENKFPLISLSAVAGVAVHVVTGGISKHLRVKL